MKLIGHSQFSTKRTVEKSMMKVTNKNLNALHYQYIWSFWSLKLEKSFHGIVCVVSPPPVITWKNPFVSFALGFNCDPILVLQSVQKCINFFFFIKNLIKQNKIQKITHLVRTEDARWTPQRHELKTLRERGSKINIPSQKSSRPTSAESSDCDADESRGCSHN